MSMDTTEKNSMIVTRRKNRWVLDWREKGKRHRAFFPTEAQARHALILKQTQLQRRPPRSANRELTELTARHLATKAGCHPNHYSATERYLQLLCQTAPANVRPTLLQPQHLVPLRRALLRYSSNTRMQAETILRGFFRQAWNAAKIHCPVNELFPRSAGLRMIRRQTTTTRQQAQAIASAAPLRARAPLQLLAMLGIEAGLRIQEVAEARAGDWNPQGQELTIRSAKMHDARVNPVNPRLAAYLHNLIPPGTDPEIKMTALANPRGTPLSKNSLSTDWTRARRAARQPKVTPHDLRRTWATEHAEHTPLPVLMELAGWKLPRTAIHYLMNRGQEAKRAAVARAWNARQAHTLEAPDVGETKPTPRKERVN
jgi:integrase